MHYLPDDVYDALLARLKGAFMVAANSTGTDLNDQLVEALCEADVMPASCAPKQLPVFEAVGVDPIDLNAFEQHMFAQAHSQSKLFKNLSRPAPTGKFELTEDGELKKLD